LRRRTRVILIVLGVAAFAGVAQLFDTFVEDANFHRIERHVAYRSAQVLSRFYSEDWDEIYQKSHFRAVINLRGGGPNAAWYRDEVAFAAAHDAVHTDFPLSANVQPSLAETERLVQLMRDAPKPMLLHCNQGADRTGLASALFVYAIQGKSAEEAGKQLSILYGHFPWLTSRTGAMDRAFAAYVAAHPPG
jgi:protein tyrosine/serine phosphatase